MIHVGLDLDAVAARFWPKVDRGNPADCWEWQAYFGTRGYGRFSLGGRAGRMEGAHRVSVLLRDGVLPNKGMDVDHLCRNTRCVNPDHLEVVTHQENNRRGLARLNGAKERAVTHCPQGHPYDGANTKMKQGRYGLQRSCRACARDYARRKRAGL